MSPSDGLSSIGRYEIVGHLAKGGMAEILLARLKGPSGFERPVAIKRILPHLAEQQRFVDMFLDEARIAAAIRHKNVVQVTDLGHTGAHLYLVMEYLEGENIASLIKRSLVEKHALPYGMTAHVIAEACAGLHAAHELCGEDGAPLGVVHRDISPQNVLVTYSGEVKVLDFGIAKLHPELGGQSDSTRTGALLGTPQYMSPEQALGQPADARADLYSLGVVLYEGATGRRPFEAEALFELLRQHIESSATPPSALRPDLPPAFEQVIVRAMEKDRSRRFQSAGEMAAALMAALPALPDAGAAAPSAPPFGALKPAPVAPTAAQTGAASRTSVGGTALAPVSVQHRSSPVGYIVGILGVLLALGGISAAVFFYFWSSRDSVNVTFEAGSGADPFAELATARTEARKHFADAELVTISVTGVRPDGTVDLKNPMHAMAFIFRSPSASKSSKQCLVSVSTSQYGTFAAPVEDSSYNCQQPTIGAPRCTLKGIMKKAPAGTKSVTFSHQVNAWNWVLMGGTASVTLVPDSC